MSRLDKKTGDRRLRSNINGCFKFAFQFGPLANNFSDFGTSNRWWRKEVSEWYENKSTDLLCLWRADVFGLIRYCTLELFIDHTEDSEAIRWDYAPTISADNTLLRVLHTAAQEEAEFSCRDKTPELAFGLVYTF